MGDDAKQKAKKFRKMSDDELMRELARHENDMDDLVSAEYQRRSLSEVASINRRLWMLLCVNTFMLLVSVATMVWAVATYMWWVESEGDWEETRKKSRESLETARKSLSEGAGTVSSAFDDARQEVESRKKSWF